MRKYILIILILISITSFSQKMEIVSFKALPKDMTASMDAPKTDMNDDKCAVIKVVTTETGFVWDIGTFAIISAEHKVSEYWLYVPYGAKAITIKHKDFGTLRNKEFGIPIEKARVYELILKTERHLIADGKGNFTINTNPTGAKILIDGIPNFNEISPFSTNSEYKTGAYKFTITKDKYYDLDTVLEIQKDTRTTFNLELKPIVGSLYISTTPSDADVFINEKFYGKTPVSINDLIIDTYNIKVKKEGYTSIKNQVEITENKKIEINKELTDKALVLITSEPSGATIIINGKEQGKTPKTLPIKLGNNNIAFEKYKYVEQSNKVNIKETTKNLNYKLTSDNLLVVKKKIAKSKMIMYSSCAVGVSSLAIGTYFQYSSNKHYTEYQDITNTEEATNLHTTIDNEIMNSYIAFGVGTIGLLSTAYFGVRLKKLNKDKIYFSFAPVKDGVLMSMKLTF